jgi:3-isopropylmalate dehydratase small subunit
MEDADPGFMEKMSAGDMIVGGKNFGCGSSREHAPIAIKAAGVSCVIAGSFARIFYRNAFNMGLPIFESEEAARGIGTGDEVEVDPATGIIKNVTKGEQYQAEPYPPFMVDLIEAGGLIPYLLEGDVHGS